MNTLLILSIILFLTQGVSQEKPILFDYPDKIIMQNSFLRVEIAKISGELLSFTHLKQDRTVNLLSKPATIHFRDMRNNKGYQLTEGKITNIFRKIYPDSVKVIFNINYNDHHQKTQYWLQIGFTLDRQALRWDALLKTNFLKDWEANIDFSMPVIEKMRYAFWTDANAPFKLPIARTVVYRMRGEVIPGGCVIPALIIYNDTSDVGLSLVSPFDLSKPGLKFQLDTNNFIISNYHLRLSRNHPAQTAVYIVPHEADWRAGLAWIYDKYPEYFNPVAKKVLEGEGWYMMIDPEWSKESLENLKRKGVTWVEFHGHFPFYGLYAPNRDSWFIILDREDISYQEWRKDSIHGLVPKTSYTKNRYVIDFLLDHNIQSYLYFQSFEARQEYAKNYFPQAIALGVNNETLPAWRSCYLMNPDPKWQWGKHCLAQIEKVLENYPKAAGIFYDRADYCDYDYAHNDGITMIDNNPVYMLGFAQAKISDLIVNRVHRLNKGVWANGPTSIEVCRGIDGIMSENLYQAPYLQYLGINRPLILLPSDTTPQQTEAKLKTALWTGHLPSIAWHRANQKCQAIDNHYRSLFSLYKGKKWILYPNALQLPEGIKGNIFLSANSDYLIALVDQAKYATKSDPFRYDLWARISLPDLKDLRYCYFLSGDYYGINQDSIYSNNGIEIRIPAQLTTTLIQLAKEPRYEITRTSSPVLLRGEPARFEFSIQNINYREKTGYAILLQTPFGTKADSFALEPSQSERINMAIKIPKNFPLGETIIRVIINRPRIDTIIFSGWVVDLVQFQLPEKIFVHLAFGEVIPFSLVNNIPRAIKVRLAGDFKEGRGKVKLSTQDLILKPLETKELTAEIVARSETGKVQLQARLEDRVIETTSLITRTMLFDSNDYFYDDFATGNMDKWDTTIGTWEVNNGIAQGSGLWHLARVKGYWQDFEFQVNTKILGSRNPAVDWLKSQIFFRVQDEGNFYRFGIQGEAVMLYKRVQNKWYFLGSYQFNPQKDVWYNLKVAVSGDKIRCFLDGELVISVKDNTFKSGGIGIGVLEDEMVNCYDDIVIRPIQF